jgi:hypothetical protein
MNVSVEVVQALRGRHDSRTFEVVEISPAVPVSGPASDTARWGDNYRTGEVGGSAWRAAVVEGAVDVPLRPTGEKSRYGAASTRERTARSDMAGNGRALSPDSGSAPTAPPPPPSRATSLRPDRPCSRP